MIHESDSTSGNSRTAPAAAQTTAAARPIVQIPIVVSSRHVHLTAAVIEELFCDRYRLHHGLALSQRQQFAAIEKVTLIGPNGRRISDVLVVGPPSTVNQVELSGTDAQILGLRAPTRESGDLIGSPGIIVQGPRSSVTLGTGVIRPRRHIHMSPADAERFHVCDRDRVHVTTGGPHRGMVFRDVLVRVAAGCALELHLDTDEANAAGVIGGEMATLNIPTVEP
jgi:propanediol utilization protein